MTISGLRLEPPHDSITTVPAIHRPLGGKTLGAWGKCQVCS